MKYELSGKIMTEFSAWRPKTCSYLADYDDRNKKAKKNKKSAIKWKFKFEGYKNCVETTQHLNEILYLGKNKLDVDSLRENQIELLKNNKLILKSQQRFRREKHIFIEEFNKVAWSANGDKRILKKNFMALFYGWGSSASRLEPL